MNTNSGDVLQAVMMIKSLIAALKMLESDNNLDDLGNVLRDAYRKIRIHCAKVDVEVLDIYQKDDKLTKSEALQLLIANKVAYREILNSGTQKKSKS